MSVSFSPYSAYGSLSSQRTGGAATSNAGTAAERPSTQAATQTSEDFVDIAFAPKASPAGTKIISETLQNTPDGGTQRTRLYEQEDGRRFSKLETISMNASSIKKTVVQQNPSGSITQYEETLNRQADGTFRRTQRYADATGETTTAITPDYQTNDPFVLSGGQFGDGFSAPSSFSYLRGTQLDLST